MALQTSGPISLDDIHVEAGGTTATQVTINDTDVLNLIGKSSATQMGFNEWYGASAGPTLQYTSTGTTYTAATTGKNATPAAITFADSAANDIVDDLWTGTTAARIYMTDLGWLNGSGGFLFGGFTMQTSSGVGVASNTGNFARPPGQNAGQYYIKAYYNNVLFFTTNAHYDENSSLLAQFGSTNRSTSLGLFATNTNPSLWKLEYYR